MNVVREYQRPLIIAGAALVALLLIWAVLVSPQNSKLTSLQSQESQLQGKQAQLNSKLATLRSEKQNLTSSCADLQKIATEIPTVQSPTDIDAEESSFESQFNGLAASSGVSLAQFSGFAPAASATGTAAAAPATSATAGSAAGGATASTGVTAVPTTLTVSGNYGQMMAFINGLDTFPRLFVIQRFVLAYGAATPASGGSTSGSSSGSSAGAASEQSPALWTGGRSTPATAGPYSLSINGSIYYTSTPNALDACQKATATLK
ncbi:MAG: hypothetical protein WB565_12415 [Acidimicrobiales bacterium]